MAGRRTGRTTRKVVAVGHRVVLAANATRHRWCSTPTPSANSDSSSCWRRCTSRTTSTASGASAGLPGVPQIACFDTAFHRTQPGLAQTVRDSARLTRRRQALRLPWPVLRIHRPRAARGARRRKRCRVIVAHLGNRASMCRDGRPQEPDIVDGLHRDRRPDDGHAQRRPRPRRAALPAGIEGHGRQRPRPGCSTRNRACSGFPASPRTCARCSPATGRKRPKPSICSAIASCARSAHSPPPPAASTHWYSPAASVKGCRHRVCARLGWLGVAIDETPTRPMRSHIPRRQCCRRAGDPDRRGVDDRPAHTGTAVTHGVR